MIPARDLSRNDPDRTGRVGRAPAGGAIGSGLQHALRLTFQALLLGGSLVRGQEAPGARVSTDALAPAVGSESADDGWAFSAAVAGYLVPDGRDYFQPTITADHGGLHLEARYNYENLETGSAWVGRNFGGGGRVTWEITPMLGGVFGETFGVAPGYKGAVSWWRLELYSEGEYVFDAGDDADSFFYNWSELSLAPVNWFRFGIVGQRTRTYQTDLDLQRGFLLGYSYRALDFTAYLFNPDESRPTFVMTMALNF
ncbi:MAG: hypothetical protein IPM17_15560 [Verrucomicrobia bacterium]|nr:hypothetical protein [Verrucomicrobiota bacterium]